MGYSYIPMVLVKWPWKIGVMMSEEQQPNTTGCVECANILQYIISSGPQVQSNWFILLKLTNFVLWM